MNVVNPFKTNGNLHVKSEWSIVHIEGLEVIIFFKKNIAFLSLKIDFVSADRADSDEMLPFAAFHQGFHCLP